jgi:hypothetical protein
MPGFVPGIRVLKDLPREGFAVRRSGMTADYTSRIAFPPRADDCELRNRALRTKSHSKTAMEAAT